MNFGNSNNQIIDKLISNKKLGSITSTRLNAPMIDRVYRTKPGCSACGKKSM
jgi:hypothetical protein